MKAANLHKLEFIKNAAKCGMDTKAIEKMSGYYILTKLAFSLIAVKK